MVNRPVDSRPTRRIWNLGRRAIAADRDAAGHGPLVMGILNVTPDSFSDGGRHVDIATAVATAVDMAQQGADIIDIGGESTRPYSTPVTEQAELDRVMPVIEQLAGRVNVPLSIDTSKAAVARAAIAAGVEIINDVTGLEGDPEMVRVAVESGVGVCVMHMRGTPQTMQDDPRYDDVVSEIEDYLRARFHWCVTQGIQPDRICLDPGIGFGKTHSHNLELLRATRRFTELGAPLLIGHSRKGFIGKVLGDSALDRDNGTIGVSLAAAAAGADVIRVHAVKPHVEALRLFLAAGGIAPLHG